MSISDLTSLLDHIDISDLYLEYLDGNDRINTSRVNKSLKELVLYSNHCPVELLIDDKFFINYIPIKLSDDNKTFIEKYKDMLSNNISTDVMKYIKDKCKCIDLHATCMCFCHTCDACQFVNHLTGTTSVWSGKCLRNMALSEKKTKLVSYLKKLLNTISTVHSSKGLNWFTSWRFWSNTTPTLYSATPTLNTSASGPYNADFYGDEMNMHVPNQYEISTTVTHQQVRPYRTTVGTLFDSFFPLLDFESLYPSVMTAIPRGLGVFALSGTPINNRSKRNKSGKNNGMGFRIMDSIDRLHNRNIIYDDIIRYDFKYKRHTNFAIQSYDIETYTGVGMVNADYDGYTTYGGGKEREDERHYEKKQYKKEKQHYTNMPKVKYPVIKAPKHKNNYR